MCNPCRWVAPRTLYDSISATASQVDATVARRTAITAGASHCLLVIFHCAFHRAACCRRYPSVCWSWAGLRVHSRLGALECFWSHLSGVCHSPAGRRGLSHRVNLCQSAKQTQRRTHASRNGGAHAELYAHFYIFVKLLEVVHAVSGCRFWSIAHTKCFLTRRARLQRRKPCAVQLCGRRAST